MASFIFRVALLSLIFGSQNNALRLENMDYDGKQDTGLSDCSAGADLFSGVVLDVNLFLEVGTKLAVCVDETLQAMDIGYTEGLTKLSETLWSVVQSFMNGALTSSQTATRDELETAVKGAITSSASIIDDAINFSETIDPDILGDLLDTAVVNTRNVLDAWCDSAPPPIVAKVINFVNASREVFDDVAIALVELVKNKDLEKALKQIEQLTQRNIIFGDHTFKIDDKIPEFGLLLGVFLKAYEAMENKKICWRASSSVPSVPAQTCPYGFEYDQVNQRCAPDAYHGRECGTSCPAAAGQQCDAVCGAGRWCCKKNNINQAASCANAKFYTNPDSTASDDYYQCVSPVMSYMTASSSLMQKEARRTKAEEAANPKTSVSLSGSIAPTCNLNSEHPVLSGLTCEAPCPDDLEKATDSNVCLEKCKGGMVGGSVSVVNLHVCGTSKTAIAVTFTDFATLAVEIGQKAEDAFSTVTKGNWTGAVELLTSVAEFAAIPKCDGSGSAALSSSTSL